MLSGLTVAPGLALAGLTTSVSLAAAMGGVQAITPAASHVPAAVTAATQPPGVTRSAGHAAPAVMVTVPRGAAASASASASTSTSASSAADHAHPGSTPACPTPHPGNGQGVGNRCTAGPPATVPGNGRATPPAQPGSAHAQPSHPAPPSQAAQPAHQHPATTAAATPRAHSRKAAP